jgi:23S rRNA (adenine-N6)-dimethyltransferase
VRILRFLRSPSLAAELVRDAGVGSHDVVVDVGAGTGRLTAELSRVAREVVAVELDPALAARLRGRWPNVRVVEGDAVAAPLPAELFRVVANLPFAGTNDVLRRLLDDPLLPLERADLIVEWGVACMRGLPWPSSVNGVLWAAFYELSVARRLPRHAFRPPPSVDAGVLVCRRRETPLVPAARAADYRSFVATGFRRGTRAVASPRTLRQVAARGPVLPRDLDAHQWAALFQAAQPTTSRGLRPRHA